MINNYHFKKYFIVSVNRFGMVEIISHTSTASIAPIALSSLPRIIEI